MDQNGKLEPQRQVKAIAEVQEAEENATKMIANANKKKDEMIKEAREKAANMLSNAITNSNIRKSDAIKKFSLELELKRKKELERAEKESKSIKTKRLSEQKRKELVKSLAKTILGV